MLQDSHCVREILELLLELIPALHGNHHGEGAPAFCDHEGIIAELRQLLPDAVADFGLGEDPSNHAISVRANVRVGCVRRRSRGRPTGRTSG